MRKREEIIRQIAKDGLCVKCKGTKMLCGRTQCPLLMRYYSLVKAEKKVDKIMYGSSPPDVFVGRLGYPKVFIGPLIPPQVGETEYMGNPKEWIDMSIGEFVDMRTSLVRGMKRFSIYDARDPNYEMIALQEMAMSRMHVDSQVEFIKKPRGRMVGNIDVEPHGPRGKMEKFKIFDVKVDNQIEKYYYDEATARESVIDLYFKGIDVPSLQRAMSMGMFGKKRKLVPTRWSITAVDGMIGEYTRERIKEFETVDKTMVFESHRMNNIFVVIFLPRVWSYELVESWYPGTFWNPYGKRVFMVSSHEFFEGRRDYAEIGGCYYAARLAVTDKLLSMRRQATVIILREAQPSYIMPVGVWQVRENVRSALNSDPKIFETEEEGIKYALSRFHIGEEEWYRNSKLLRDLRVQRRIDDFAVHRNLR